MTPGTSAFVEFARACPHRIEIRGERRPGNALNVEIGAPSARCFLKTPASWGESAPSAARWIMSGGDPLIFGSCSRRCALGQTWCDDCGHRGEHHIDGVCRVHAGGEHFPCGCEAPPPGGALHSQERLR